MGVGVSSDDLERIQKIHDEDETSEMGREAYREEVYFRVAHRHRRTLLKLLREQIADNEKLRSLDPASAHGSAKALAWARLR